MVRKGNVAIRDLLLGKGHLISPHLLNDAMRLIEHYDAWLEEFDALRGQASSGKGADFVFVGPKGYAFPIDAEARYKDEFKKLQQELYKVKQGGSAELKEGGRL